MTISHYSTTHWIRILPDGTREVWQRKPDGAAAHPSDVATCTCCAGATWWAPLTDLRLLAAVADVRAMEQPCTCVMVIDNDGVLEPPKIADMGDHNGGRPFMVRFSWTMGLPWAPPIEVRDVDGVLVVFGADGTKVATAQRGMSHDDVVHEMRIARY